MYGFVSLLSVAVTYIKFLLLFPIFEAAFSGTVL